MKLREILLRLRREYFCSDLSRIHLFIYVIYLFIDAFSLLLLLLFSTFLCTSPAPWAPSSSTARSVSLWQYEFNRQPPPFTICLPAFFSSLALLPPPAPPPLLLVLFQLLLLLVGVVCVMRFQCRRVDFSWRPAKECQYYLSSLVCFSMKRQTDSAACSLSSSLWVSRSSGHKSIGC